MDDIKPLEMSPLGALVGRQLGGPSLSQHLGQQDILEWAGRSEDEKMQLAKDFESVLLSRVFDQVSESIKGWGQEEDGASQQIEGLFWNYLAQDVANKGGFGLWQDICRHLKELEDADTRAVSVDGEL
jgi:hypothetical protein